MSITLNELLAYSDRLPDQSSEEARILRELIGQREAEMRARIADSIATVSQRENWKLHQCAALARRVERAPAETLESVYEYFHDRSIGQPHAVVVEIVSALMAGLPMPVVPSQTFAANSAGVNAGARARVHAVEISHTADTSAAPIIDLHGRMRLLESMVAPTPGMGCGIQGIRLMRMVALMSKARSARLEQMRISGTQAIYRHM